MDENAIIFETLIRDLYGGVNRHRVPFSSADEFRALERAVAQNADSNFLLRLGHLIGILGGGVFLFLTDNELESNIENELEIILENLQDLESLNESVLRIREIFDSLDI